MIVVKYPPINPGESEIEVRYDEHGMCKVYRELMEILIESYRELAQKDSEYEIRRQTIDEFARAYEKVEVYGCIGCKHLEDDVHCWECIAEQLKEKKGDRNEN